MTVDLDLHTYVGGITRSGKTTYLRWLMRQSRRRGIFANTQASTPPPRWHRMRSAPSMRDVVEHRRVSWEGDPADMVRQLNGVVRAAHQVGDSLGPDGTVAPWLTIFVSEAWMYEPKGALPGALTRLMAQGSRYGTVGIIDSQRGANVSHTALMQVSQVILFRIAPGEREYFGRIWEPIPDAAWAHIQQPYHSILWQGSGWELQGPVPV